MVPFIQQMLTKLDVEQRIQTYSDLQQALCECTHAKNTLSLHRGYTPELIVFGRRSRLPGSICGGELAPAQEMALDEGRELSQTEFRKELLVFWLENEHELLSTPIENPETEVITNPAGNSENDTLPISPTFQPDIEPPTNPSQEGSRQTTIEAEEPQTENVPSEATDEILYLTCEEETCLITDAPSDSVWRTEFELSIPEEFQDREPTPSESES